MIGVSAWYPLVRYSNDSVRHIFGDTTGNHIADTILRALRANPDGLSRTDIYSDLFGRNTKAEKIDDALASLLATGMVRQQRLDRTGGRPANVFFAS